MFDKAFMPTTNARTHRLDQPKKPQELILKRILLLGFAKAHRLECPSMGDF